MQELTDILTKLTADLGITILENAQRFKSAFTDYSQGKFRGERELLIKIIEIGAFNAITNAEDLSIAKKLLVKRLHEEYFWEEKICSKFINVYTSVLRNDNISSKPITPIADKVYRTRNIWVCGKCGGSNDLKEDYCLSCKKEFWPE